MYVFKSISNYIQRACMHACDQLRICISTSYLATTRIRGIIMLTPLVYNKV